MGRNDVASPLYATYARADLAFDRGEGAWLETTDGDRYLDFGSGVAVTVLGHAHPHLVATLKSSYLQMHRWMQNGHLAPWRLDQSSQQSHRGLRP